MDPWVVLKKQYLDDKSSGKLGPSALAAAATAGGVEAAAAGPVLNISAFQRQIAPSAYPSVMGPPPAIPQYAMSSAKAGAGAGAGMPAALVTTTLQPPPPPSGYGVYGSGYPSGGSAYSSAATSAVAVRKAPAAPISHSLNGQGWYSQTAGRAVNQVLLLPFFILPQDTRSSAPLLLMLFMTVHWSCDSPQ